MAVDRKCRPRPMFAATRQHCRYAANRPIHALGQNIRVDLAVPYRTQFGKSHRHDFIADLGPFSGQPQGQKIAYFVQARVVALNDSVMQPSDMRLEARLSSQSRAYLLAGCERRSLTQSRPSRSTPIGARRPGLSRPTTVDRGREGPSHASSTCCAVRYPPKASIRNAVPRPETRSVWLSIASKEIIGWRTPSGLVSETGGDRLRVRG